MTPLPPRPPPSPATFSGRTVLVVDDEQFSRRVLERMLLGLGFGTVVEADDGRTAMVALDGHAGRIDVVVSDFNMPEMNGLQLLRAIRSGAAGTRHDLPVILLTGRADRRLVGSAMALDCDGFLIKPTSRDQVRERLERVTALDRQIRPPAYYASVSLESVRPAADAASDPAATPLGPIPLDEVREGMILAADVVATGGDVLLSAGSVLSRQVLTMLGDLRPFEASVGRLLVLAPPPR